LLRFGAGFDARVMALDQLQGVGSTADFFQASRCPPVSILGKAIDNATPSWPLAGA
jgi:hypothetical protein